MKERSPATTAAFLGGILLAGYGLLVTLRVLAHEAFALGIALIIAGGLLLWFSQRSRKTLDAPLPAREGKPTVPASRGQLIATLLIGGFAAGGVLAYNLLAGSTMTPWEIGIVAYGVALLAVAPWLHRRIGPTSMGNLVAWSLPVIAAPLGVFALDAAMKGQVGSSPVDAFLVYGLVAPMAWSLGILGFDVQSIGQNVVMGTPRGSLVLNIGLICAGFQAGILFMGVLGLHAWKEKTPPGRLTAYLALGLFGVYVANLTRLVILALVGYHWGGAVLQTAHAHLGWIVFFIWILLFWWIVLRHLEGTPKKARPQTPETA